MAPRTLIDRGGTFASTIGLAAPFDQTMATNIENFFGFDQDSWAMSAEMLRDKEKDYDEKVLTKMMEKVVERLTSLYEFVDAYPYEDTDNFRQNMFQQLNKGWVYMVGRLNYRDLFNGKGAGPTRFDPTVIPAPDPGPNNKVLLITFRETT